MLHLEISSYVKVYFMAIHSSLCSISVFVCARRTCVIPHVGTLCNRSVLSYCHILAYPYCHILAYLFIS